MAATYYRMPGMNGLRAKLDIKAIRGDQPVKVISAFADEVTKTTAEFLTSLLPNLRLIVVDNLSPQS